MRSFTLLNTDDFSKYKMADDKGYSLSLAPNILDAMDNDIGTNWCNAASPFGDGDAGSPGEENSCQ